MNYKAWLISTLNQAKEDKASCLPNALSLPQLYWAKDMKVLKIFLVQHKFQKYIHFWWHSNTEIQTMLLSEWLFYLKSKQHWQSLRNCFDLYLRNRKRVLRVSIKF